jgi:hypothetical protein
MKPDALQVSGHPRRDVHKPFDAIQAIRERGFESHRHAGASFPGTHYEDSRCFANPLLGFNRSLDQLLRPHGIDRGLPDTQRVLARHDTVPCVESLLLQ